MIGLVAPVLIATGLALGRGGSLDAWARQRIRWWPLAVVALGIQLPLYSPPVNAWPPVTTAGTVLGLFTMLLVLVVILRNATGAMQPACLLAALGIALNLIVMGANDGVMPRAEELAPLLGDWGVRAGSRDAVVTNTAPLRPGARLSVLADTLPEPAWLPLANLVSPGDLALSFGAAWWAFLVTRGPTRRGARQR
jgi:hypothetical protein